MLGSEVAERLPIIIFPRLRPGKASAFTKVAVKAMEAKQAYKNYLRSKHWQELKDKKESVSSKQCFVCKARDSIHCHHLFYRPSWSDTQPKDLRWLCAHCHEIAHAFIAVGKIKLRDENGKWGRRTWEIIRAELKRIKQGKRSILEKLQNKQFVAQALREKRKQEGYEAYRKSQSSSSQASLRSA